MLRTWGPAGSLTLYFSSWHVETSKVRKFWTFNPFYPELSEMLITFYTVIILVYFGVFQIWAFFLHIRCLGFFLFFCAYYFLLILWMRFKRKKNSTTNLREEKKYTLTFFFLNLDSFWSFFPFYKFSACCWNPASVWTLGNPQARWILGARGSTSIWSPPSLCDQAEQGGPVWGFCSRRWLGGHLPSFL